MLRHKRWDTKFAHPQLAGASGTWLNNEESIVFWEGMSDTRGIGLQALVHPTPGDYSLLLTHGVQTDKYVQALVCSVTTGTRPCFNANVNGYASDYTNDIEIAFQTDPVASAASFDPSSATAMTEATNRIGFVLLYNDNSRGWGHYDDDGSFLLKHKTKNFIVAPQAGGSAAVPVYNGLRLVWKACPGNACTSAYTRDDYFDYGFVFVNENGAVCLPPGV